jgi:toxin ParE1/3/4
MPPYRVAFAPRAEAQLDQLYAYIAANAGEPTADRYVSAIIEHCMVLATFPERGTKRDEIRPDLRTIGYKRSVTIAFTVDHIGKAVTILGIFYGGQNYGAMLEDDETE